MNSTASFRKTTQVPPQRHNVSHAKSYTEVITSENDLVHSQIFSPYNTTVWPGEVTRSTHAKIYKGTHFSTGPTTSSRHSKTKAIEISTGPTTSSRHSKN